MGNNRQAQIRFNVIDHCLQRTNVKWTWRELAEECTNAVYEMTGERETFSRSCIFRDIKQMKAEPPHGFGAPIQFFRKEKTYRYTIAGFSIQKSPIPDRDLKMLKDALALLQQFPQLGGAAPWLQLSTRVKHMLHMNEGESKLPIVQFDTAPDTSALRWLPKLYNAIDKKKALLLRYKPFTEDALKVHISPWLLKEYNRRWFLLAWSFEQQLIRTYALDRIEQLEVAESHPYFIRHDFDPNSYYQHIIGLSIPEDQPPQKIRFKASPLRARYIQTKPIHHSQKVVEQTATYTLFELFLIPNIEFKQILLAFSPEIEVLSPSSLRQEVKELLQKGIDGIVS